MNAILYYLMTFAEAAVGVFGVRSVYEQPRYEVVRTLPGGVELRDYAPRQAVETDNTNDSAAFNRLFGYITGANATQSKVAMTVPVAQSGERIAMTSPVQTQAASGGTMRFYLPVAVVRAGAPAPTDPAVRLVSVPAERIAARQFSGSMDRAAADRQKQALLDALKRNDIMPRGAPFLLTYDAPFTIPFLRRNEVAVEVARQ